MINYADRINSLPPYLFAAIDKAKAEVIKKGVDVINLGIGDPDMPTPPHIVEAMKKSLDNADRHKYPSYEGMLSFRKAAAQWYRKTMNVTLDPEDEVLTLIGSKEGIAHIPLAFLNPGMYLLFLIRISCLQYRIHTCKRKTLQDAASC